MRRGFVVLAMVLLGACGDDGGSSGGDGGSGACVNGAPGVQVHVTVACTLVSPCEFIDPAVRLNFPSAGLVEYGAEEGVTIEAFAGGTSATFGLDYPSNANPGPATATFIARTVAAGYHIHGEMSFESYPPGCTMVELPSMDALGEL